MDGVDGVDEEDQADQAGLGGSLGPMDPLDLPHPHLPADRRGRASFGRMGDTGS